MLAYDNPRIRAAQNAGDYSNDVVMAERRYENIRPVLSKISAERPYCREGAASAQINQRYGRGDKFEQNAFPFRQDKTCLIPQRGELLSEVDSHAFRTPVRKRAEEKGDSQRPDAGSWMLACHILLIE
jgi:hypothetical protein